MLYNKIDKSIFEVRLCVLQGTPFPPPLRKILALSTNIRLSAHTEIRCSSSGTLHTLTFMRECQLYFQQGRMLEDIQLPLMGDIKPLALWLQMRLRHRLRPLQGPSK